MIDKLPCINCITLAACRSYIINNPNNHLESGMPLCRFLIAEKQCLEAAEYVFYIDRESDQRVQVDIVRLSKMYKYLKSGIL